MIKAIIFDFDGVLVESAQIKTEAFREIFSQWHDKTDEGVAYHLKNMGISRYVKFKYFYENILGEPYSDEIANRLGKQFSEIVFEKIKNAPFVNGAESFLKKNYQKYLLFIASGTLQDELNDIVKTRGMERYFKGVMGTPATKSEIISNILSTYGIKGKEVVFVGDAESDMKAAKNTGTYFIVRITSENTELLDYSQYRIEGMMQLENRIREINEI